MTPLHDILLRQIEQDGPLTVAQYMMLCLQHPQHGYYVTRNPLGKRGDFTTAPEISQMFGELIGLCLAQSWLDQGAPKRFALAELGPGRGTLMADALRATQRVPGFHDALEVHLVETSPPLRAVQRTTLGDQQVQWHDDLGALPDAPLYLIANEFFDALPIRQFLRSGDGWSERVIGAQAGQLQWGLTAAHPLATLAHRLDDTKKGDCVEICPSAQAYAAEIGQRIHDHGGMALIIDYGAWRSRGDSFQAVRAHQKVPVLGTPGQADLTAHVDFQALVSQVACAHSQLTPQGVFLERLGITHRAQALAQRLTGAALDAHVAAHRRLTHPEEMGTVFKTIALFPNSAAPPPGLTP